VNEGLGRKEGCRKVNLEMQADTTSSAVAELCPRVAAAAWYCVRSQLKHEHIAAAHLCLIPGVEVFNPRLRLLRATRRGQVWSTESLFPNYVFTRFVLESKLEKVRYTPSVKMVVQFGDTVPTIPDSVIQQLQQDLEGLSSRVLVEAPDEGEEVEVAAGAFKGLNGRVMRVLPAKRRVQILLDMMGRSVAAELNLELLLFRKRDAAGLVLREVDQVARSGAMIHGLSRLAENLCRQAA
jgi:transcriptional antiterminator RfaH